MFRDLAPLSFALLLLSIASLDMCQGFKPLDLRQIPSRRKSKRDRSAATSTTQLCATLGFRSATAKDVFEARKILFQEAMNPLSISAERLVVAFHDFSDGSNESMIGFGQVRPLDDAFSELASLYVAPEERGKGYGSELVTELLARHDASVDDANPTTQVCLLTLESTTEFYERLGFELVSKTDVQETMPSSLQFEYAAGTLVSSILGNGLVCMQRRR